MFARLKNLFQRHVEFAPQRLDIDRGLYITIGLLLLFGLVMLASASSIVAYNTYNDTYYFFKRQFVAIVAGGALFWFFSKVDYRKWRLFALPAFIVSILLLLLVFIPGLGREINGSRSWINVFGMSVQPAELVKLCFIVYLAALFEKAEETAKRFKTFLLIFGLLAVLMLLQPDPGTLFILTAVSFGMYYIGGGKLKHIIICAIIGVMGLAVLVNLPGQGYRLDRFRCFMDQSRDTDSACYQINQSLIAIGSGGITGRGLGESRQKFLYLPEVQNDFIFAIIAEEAGLIGSAIVIILFVMLAQRAARTGRQAPDAFGRNIAAGVMIWISAQVFLNIGGITNFLPMTGVPLPLISYGGTAIVALLSGLGLVANISRYRAS